MKENAVTHFQLLKAEADCKAIDGLAEEFEKKNSRRPTSIQELVKAGLLQGTPADPTGRPYVLDAEGKAELILKVRSRRKDVLQQDVSNLANQH